MRAARDPERDLGNGGDHRALVRRLAGYALLSGIVLGYHGLGSVLGVVDISRSRGAVSYSALMALGFAAGWAIVTFYRTALKTRTGPDLLRSFRMCVASKDTIERFATLFPLLLLLRLFFDAFSAWKLAIPSFHEYGRWDPPLANLDGWLHLSDPWRWTHALIGPYGTGLLDWFYVWGWWGGKIWAMAFILTFDRLDRRLHFLLASAITWIVGGTVIATLFPSGGPIYFARLGLDSRFDELLAILGEHAPQASFTADYLWDLYLTRDAAHITGISAFPSMHVAAATLLAIWGWSTHRLLGMVLTVNALLVMLGSVHLGWHYAIDGYGGAVLALASWKVVGTITGRGDDLIRAGSAESGGESGKAMAASVGRGTG